jgi:hypothetical protein
MRNPHKFAIARNEAGQVGVIHSDKALNSYDGKKLLWIGRILFPVELFGLQWTSENPVVLLDNPMPSNKDIERQLVAAIRAALLDAGAKPTEPPEGFPAPLQLDFMVATTENLNGEMVWQKYFIKAIDGLVKEVMKSDNGQFADLSASVRFDMQMQAIVVRLESCRGSIQGWHTYMYDRCFSTDTKS